MQKQMQYWMGLGLVGCSVAIALPVQAGDAVLQTGEQARPATTVAEWFAQGGTPQASVQVTGIQLNLDLLLSLGEQPDAYADVFIIHKGEVFDDPSQQIPYLGDRISTQPVNLGNRDQPSLETLVALKADLILGEMGSARATYSSLSQIAPTLLWEQRTQAGKWQVTIHAIAQALGDEERAEEAIAQYESLIQQARNELAPVVATHPKVLLSGLMTLLSPALSLNPIAIWERCFKVWVSNLSPLQAKLMRLIYRWRCCLLWLRPTPFLCWGMT